MRITYDRKADALCIAFGEGPATVGQPQGYIRQPQGYVQELAEGIAVDWDGEGRLLGIEILDASKKLADPEALRRFALEALPVLG